MSFRMKTTLGQAPHGSIFVALIVGTVSSRIISISTVLHSRGSGCTIPMAGGMLTPQVRIRRMSGGLSMARITTSTVLATCAPIG